MQEFQLMVVEKQSSRQLLGAASSIIEAQSKACVVSLLESSLILTGKSNNYIIGCKKTAACSS